ncbi:MAG: hypothetical protein C0511_12305 [Hyphomicrobium sp.]|nr:hypothetical protein [Hyphomicrobium sp.]
MTTQLYTVTVTDLGSYRVTVAADTPREAENIAKTLLTEEATNLPAGTSIVSREVAATAEPATDLLVRRFQVSATYAIEFAMIVPGTDVRDAERHARRLYDENCGPFEFEMGEEHVGPFTAREVVS